ncbi:hypothetical protein Q8A73_020217 [Channa argus]|nr:hypothetical protein Q8A73_020217 [Channa argus]
MTFGLTNALAVFQNLVNDVLGDMLNRFVFVYLDDILIFSTSETEHVTHVRKVLSHLYQNNLFVNAEKCVFHAPSVSFLGYIVSPAGVEMDLGKVSAVRDWPVPESRKQLLHFLGFANFYRCFINNYSSIAAPLYKLTLCKSSFSWSPSASQDFSHLKDTFSSAPNLSLPDRSNQFIVEVDASDVGVGAVDSKVHPWGFFSRRLSEAEQIYDVGNRELLAVKLALEQWMHWLEGAEHPFVVLTDHKNLEYLKTAKRLNPRQARGSSGGLPWQRMSGSLFQAVPSVLRLKPAAPPPDGLLHPLPIPRQPWSHISVDFVTGLPPYQGNTVILMVVDRFSKMAHFIPLPALPTAKETAKTLRHIFRIHGLPRDVISNRGPQFISFRLLGVTDSHSSGFHPQSNDQNERLNQDLENGLRVLCSRELSS